MLKLPPYRICKAAHLRFGRRGERLAIRLLKERGMKVLCANYEGSRGEIDIVALDGEVLCFVEVKARRPSKRSRPADAVTLRKKWRLVQTADHYLGQLNYPRLSYRFDIVEIIMDSRKLREARHWPAAFIGEEVRRIMSARKRRKVSGK